MTNDMLHDFVCSGAKTIMHNNLSRIVRKPGPDVIKRFHSQHG